MMATQADFIRRFLIEDADVRGELVRLGPSYRTLLESHYYPPPVRDILGQLLAAAPLLMATVKFAGRLILELRGDGPLHLVVAECRSDRSLRGLARWSEPLVDPGFSTLVGTGQLLITLVAERGGEPWQGRVPLQGGSVAAALEHYFERSEQIATRVWLAGGEDTAGGLLVQRLPGAGEQSPPLAQAARQLAEVAGGTDLLGADDLLAHAPEDLLRLALPGHEVRLFEAQALEFRCGCSPERVEGMLRALGRVELESLRAERGEAEVTCEFCNRRYAYAGRELQALIDAAAASEG